MNILMQIISTLLAIFSLVGCSSIPFLETSKRVEPKPASTEKSIGELLEDQARANAAVKAAFAKAKHTDVLEQAQEDDEKGEGQISREICFSEYQIATAKSELSKQKQLTNQTGIQNMSAIHGAAAQLLEHKNIRAQRIKEYKDLTGHQFDSKKECEN